MKIFKYAFWGYKILLLCAVSFCSELSAQVIYQMEHPINSVKKNDTTFLYSDKDRNVDICLKITDATIIISINNKSANRIYIEWQNARMNGDEVGFGSDSATSFRYVKPDEAVSPNSASVLRSVFAKNQFSVEEFLNEHPLSRRNIVMNEGSSFSTISIPIRFDEKSYKEYQFDITGFLSWEFIKKGMTKKEVNKAIRREMGFCMLRLTPILKEKLGENMCKYHYDYVGVNGFIVYKKGVVSEVSLKSTFK